MKRALLPLNALRAFDAAARHMSFKKAADELAVTPAAVSQQIRSLEEYLGVLLFKRTKRELVLTSQAEKALKNLEAGFKAFEDAVATLLSLEQDHTLKISVSPSFASKWLIPRLGEYYETSEDIAVHVSASMNLVSFAHEECDLAIRYGSGHYPGLYVEQILRDEVFPVCAPSVADGLKTADDLLAMTLIHDDGSARDESCPSWTLWFKTAGIALPSKGRRDLHFNLSTLALEAAASGRGVALAKSTIAEADLRSGRLVRPFKGSAPVDFAYYIVCPEAHLSLPKVQSFVAWLRDAAAEARGEI